MSAAQNVSRRPPQRWVTLREAATAERGSLPMVMLVVLIGMALGAVLVPVLLTQIRSSSFLTSRQDSLAAAQSGTDVVVGRIRAAAPSGQGDSSTLPCADAAVSSGPGAPITGTVDAPGPAGYRVVVQYYRRDPVAFPADSAMLCVPGNGPYDPGDATVVPGFARITSTGTGATGGGRSSGRTVVTTYVFQTTNRPVAGGVIRIYGSNNRCLDAGPTPAAGTVLLLQACSDATAPTAQQVFTYRSDLTIQLISSTTTTDNGLCLDTDVSSGQVVPGNTVYLAACNALGNPPWEQQWSYNDVGGFTAARPASRTDGGLSGLCLAVPSNQAAGSSLTVKSCDNSTTSAAQSWVPSPNVGSGGAGAPQLVNFSQFGRCLDVTGQQVGAAYLIAYPCKQNPRASVVKWNQKFSYDASSRWLSTVPDGSSTQYCLYSPRTQNGYVRLTPCSSPGSGISAAQLQWTSTGADAAAYSDRYRFIDSSTDTARCLSILTPPPSGDWAYIVVATCSDGTEQKWNAEPAVSTSTRQDIAEQATPVSTATPTG